MRIVLNKHAHRGSRTYDYLAFRLALAEQLMGTFRGRVSRVGRPRSLDQMDVTRLDVSLGHWPEMADKHLECFVCLKVRETKKLTRKDYRHEIRLTCSVCKVHLCISKDRNCFKKFHTLTRYWT